MHFLVRPCLFYVVYALFTSSPLTQAEVTMTPLVTFGGGDGYLGPGENGYQFLGTNSNERGLGFSYVTGHLFLVSRNGTPSVRILDGFTGDELGTLKTTGVSGGSPGFALNMLDVGDDGVIYAANLTTGVSFTEPFKIYRWENESSTPTVVYNSSISGGAIATGRLGDSFTVFGRANGVVAAAGYGANAALSGTNSYLSLNLPPLPPTTPTFAAPVASGDFRLGLTFVDSATVIGAQDSSVRLTSFSGGTGTLRATLTLTNGSERPMAYSVIPLTGGRAMPVLATIETGDTSTNLVRVYDMSNLFSPVLVASARTAPGTATANAGGMGDIAWGAFLDNQRTLYAMNTNNGIQAFIVTVPEPMSAGLLVTGAGWFVARRRRKL